MSSNKQPKAIMIVIGNEILSGRTKDKNIGWLAEKLTINGIKLIEARIISDDHDVIVNTIQSLYKRVDYLFTSGGIGPTHDDITTNSIADAFNVKVEINKEALRRLKVHYKDTDIELNSSRMKMACIPKGADLIDNPVSAAPGFRIQNVYVMAGIPKIMQAMLDGILISLKGGDKTISVTISCSIGEGTIAEGISEIEEFHEDVEIGCYPWFRSGTFGSSLVIRSMDRSKIEVAALDVKNLIKKFGGKPHNFD